MASSTQYTQEYQKAVTAYIQGNYDQAATIVDKLVITRPDDPNIRLLRGHIYCCQEQYQPAQEQYELVLNLTSDPELINCANESLSKTLELVDIGGANGGNAYEEDWDSDEPTGLQMGHTFIQTNQALSQTESVSAQFQASDSLPEDLSVPAEFSLTSTDEALSGESDLDPFAISIAVEAPKSRNLDWSDIPTDLGAIDGDSDFVGLNFDQGPALEADELDSENEMTMLMPNQPDLSALDSELVVSVGEVSLGNLDNLFGDPFATDIGDGDVFVTETPQAWSEPNSREPSPQPSQPAVEASLETTQDFDFDFDPNALGDMDDLGDLGDIADLEEFDGLEDFDLDNISDLSGDLNDFGQTESLAIDEFATEIQLEGNVPAPEPIANFFAEELDGIAELEFSESISSLVTDSVTPIEELSQTEVTPSELGLDLDWDEEPAIARSSELELPGEIQSEPDSDYLEDFFADNLADDSGIALDFEADAALLSLDGESGQPNGEAAETAVYFATEPGLETQALPEAELTQSPLPGLDVVDLLEFTDTDIPLELEETSDEDDLTAFLETPEPNSESGSSPSSLDLDSIPSALEEDGEDLFGDYFAAQPTPGTAWEESEEVDPIFMNATDTAEPPSIPTGSTFADPDAEGAEPNLELLELPELEIFGTGAGEFDFGEVESSESPVGVSPQWEMDTFQASELPLPIDLEGESAARMNETFAIVPEDLDLSAELSQLPDLDFGDNDAPSIAQASAELEDLSAFTQPAPIPIPPPVPSPLLRPVVATTTSLSSSDTSASSFSKRNTTTALTVGVVSALASGLVGLGINQGENVPSALLGGLAGGFAGGVAAYALGRRNVDHIKRCTTDLQAQFNAVITGDISATATVFAPDELGQLATSFNTMTQSIQGVMAESQQKAEENERQRDDLQRQVIRLLDDVEGAARGDLTVQAEVTADVLGAVADSFNLTIFNLRKIVQQVKVAARQVNKGATDNETFARSLSSDALRQAEELAVTLNSVQMMTNAIQRVAESAKEANLVARNATEAALKGGEAVERTVAGILQIRETVAETTRKVKHLAESSQEISKIVGLISQISARTNLLALNASIEAARAGESGKGFAIVADEVRQLADRAAKSSKEIEQIVLQIQSETGAVMTAMEEGTQQVIEGTRRAEQAKHSLEDIIQVSSQIDSLVRSITSATVEQTETARSMAHVMQSVELTAQATSQEAQRVSDSLHNLVTVARDLQSSVERFKVEQTEEQG
ncbi:HAMP domain-containing methyl-accepting chemotaxis protein [Thermosynechococcaceae cyanobacterium BACA0444]|uniref:HAMP domain-containing methyl-accepting chemotaxis protein n=1 Tax=Pseudocalidococcus azoricus BACA0444 TaxID=2918990 RepID=A0AAE4FQV6_9CYAN|nr:HAMP domain-containing methyl-accepting chemotaxis protein [Pseudocalidococcus azoricus]MDS3859607.1 HAMP domain-containing methyl-accepting chemotaxis protein [Pseudocalidococcus azoricus BACA0444]